MQTKIQNKTVPAQLLGQTQEMLTSLLGISYLNADMHNLMEQLHFVSKESGYNQIIEYLKVLIKEELSNSDINLIINQLVNNESYFFRHKAQLDYCIQKIIPELDNSFPSDTGSLRLWHPGCARGEEPYSLAILLNEESLFGKRELEIFGSDINLSCINQARLGYYSEWSLRTVPLQLLTKYFYHNQNRFQLRSDIIDRVKYSHIQLHEKEWSRFVWLHYPFHLIMCRNVFIYMNREVIEHILEQFWEVLAWGGYLLLSPAESLHDIKHKFIPIRTSCGIIYAKEKNTKILNENKSDTENELRHLDERKKTVQDPIEFTKSRINGALTSANLAYQLSLWDDVINTIKPFKGDLDVDMLLLKTVYKKKDYILLETLSKHALSAHPDHVMGYYFYALVSSKNGEDNQALSYLEKALHLDSTFIAAYVQCARLYQRLNRHREVEATISKLIQLLEGLKPDDELLFIEERSVNDLLVFLQLFESTIS